MSGMADKLTDTIHDGLICFRKIERLRIDFTAPIKQLLVTFVFGIAHGLDEFFVAVNAPAILRGTGPFAVDTARMREILLRDCFDQDRVSPVVAEIVRIFKSLLHIRRDAAEFHAPLIDHGFEIVGARHAVSLVADLKIVKTRGLPEKHGSFLR